MFRSAVTRSVNGGVRAQIMVMISVSLGFFLGGGLLYSVAGGDIYEGAVIMQISGAMGADEMLGNMGRNHRGEEGRCAIDEVSERGWAGFMCDVCTVWAAVLWSGECGVYFLFKRICVLLLLVVVGWSYL